MSFQMSDSKIIQIRRDAAVAELNRNLALLAELKQTLSSPIHLASVATAQRLAKESGTALALRVRELTATVQRLAAEQVRRAVLGGDDTVQLLLERLPDSFSGDDLIVSDANVDHVVVSLWRGCCRALELDPASAIPVAPKLRSWLRLCHDSFRLKPRWQPFVSDEDDATARKLLDVAARPVADVVRAALLRGDLAAAAAGFAAEVFAVDCRVDAVSQLKLHRDDVEGVAAAAWPTFRQRHKLPAETQLPPGVAAAVEAMTTKQPTGELVVTDAYAEARASWIRSNRAAAERWAPCSLAMEDQDADRLWRANMAKHGLHT